MTSPEQPAAPTCTATGCQHATTPGAMLCAVDERRLGDWLAQLQQEYELLSAAPSMQGREIGTIGGATLASQRSPGLTHVMALRAPRRGTGRIAYDDADPWGIDGTPSVFETLASWAGRVREDRDLTPPRLDLAYVRTARPAGPVCDPWAPRCGHHTCEVWTFRANVAAPLTVATERRLLAAHLEWIVGQDWAGEFHDEMRGLWGALRSANGHGAPKPQDPVLTTGQVADHLGITPRGVRKAVERGSLVAAGRDGDGWLFRSSDVASYMVTRRSDAVA